MCITCILIPVLIGLICALLGYLLGKLLSKNSGESVTLRADLDSMRLEKEKHFKASSTLSGDVDLWKTKFGKLEAEFAAYKTQFSALPDDSALKAKIAALQADLDACKSNSLELQATIQGMRAELASPKMSVSAPVLIPFDAETASNVFGKKVMQDDLKIVEGIGPKIEELFHAAGIKTWKALSETSVEKCKQVLDSGGERFSIHDPATWPKQCELAYQGKWQQLKEWQDKLDGGKE